MCHSTEQKPSSEQELSCSSGISLAQHPAQCILWVLAHLTDSTSTSPVLPGAELSVLYHSSGKQKNQLTAHILTPLFDSGL